ncbi:MAG: hypothetical protein HKN93_03285 [Acidimicrobiia bacterium]|nr:hypothetical protein [Acidimicrobiia bacterium]
MDLIVELFRHNKMMNDRLMDACRALTDDHLRTGVEGTYGSVGATLVHTANSQHAYAEGLLQRGRGDRLPEDPFPGFEALAEQFLSGNALLEEAAAIGVQNRTVTVTGDDPPGTWTMPASLFLVQAINHATEHRSQIATILTQLGVEPPSMDGWTYFFDGGHMTDVD